MEYNKLYFLILNARLQFLLFLEQYIRQLLYLTLLQYMMHSEKQGLQKNRNLHVSLIHPEKKYQQIRAVHRTQQNPRFITHVNDYDSDDQQNIELRKELEKLKRQIKQKKKGMRRDKKVIVGSGFGMDITQFFKFKKKKQIRGEHQSIIDEVSGKTFSLIILFYSVLNTAMIQPWTQHIQANKYLRFSWRFIMQSLMLIPFILHEKRTYKQANIKYSLGYIFSLENIKKVYLCSFASSFYFTLITTTFQWTYISHAVFLAGMSNFFLSLDRSYRGKGHEFQPGGQLLILIGILCILTDSYTLDDTNIPPSAYEYANTGFLTRTKWQRVIADIVALTLGFIMSKFSVFNADMKNHYPPFLGMFLTNIFTSINMSFSAFFFNGATFTFEPEYGVFSIFSQQHFAVFLYMSIILCLGLIISTVLIAKLFPDPIIPSIAMCFEAPVGGFLIQLTGIQAMPGPFAFIGFCLILPGNFLILVGKWINQKIHKKEQIQDKKRLTQLIKLSEQKSIQLMSKKSMELKLFDSSQFIFKKDLNSERNSMFSKIPKLKQQDFLEIDSPIQKHIILKIPKLNKVESRTSSDNQK